MGPHGEVGHRAHGPEATDENDRAIQDRVARVDERVILIVEVPVQTPRSINLMFDRVDALAQGWDRFAYVADLTEAKRPDPETRAALRSRVVRVRPRIVHVAIVVGNNLIMRAMARLFAHGMGLVSVSIHVTRAEAIEEAVRAMGR